MMMLTAVQDNWINGFWTGFTCSKGSSYRHSRFPPPLDGTLSDEGGLCCPKHQSRLESGMFCVVNFRIFDTVGFGSLNPHYNRKPILDKSGLGLRI